MCLSPEFMTQGKLRGCRVLEEVATDPRGGICEYAYKGCEGAKDGKTFRDYCEYDGEFCSKKFKLEMEKEE